MNGAFNPMADNPLHDRDDLARALFALLEPLRACFSPSGARVAVDMAGAAFDRAAIELEGFARPLWGLVPATMGGFDTGEWWDLYRRGLTAGTDPAHPDYWGEVTPVDQRQVEAAAIGFALRCCPEQIWEPLAPDAKERVARWLTRARDCAFSDNNWKFFRLMIDLGLDAIGHPGEPEGHDRYLGEIDSFLLEDGWYRDGHTRQADHYVAFAVHYYGLLYAALARGRENRRDAFRQRARGFAPDYAAWFGRDGACVPIGRSLTYRFAMAGFWGALAFAGEEALPWGEIKGLFLRHIRWWSHRPITGRGGLLSVGYAYPDPLIAENYNSACSPYWACKAFLPLALGSDHPFWTARESDVTDGAVMAQAAPGLVLRRVTGDAIALSSGQSNPAIRHGVEKYAKFAYSSAHAFSIESDLRQAERCSLDSMLGLIDADGTLRLRESCEEARIGPQGLWSRWRPFRDVTVETWLWWDGPWQMRHHRITSPRPLRCIEGGMAVRAGASVRPEGGKHSVAVAGKDGWSGIIDIGGARQGRLLDAEPNTHLLHPRAWIPQVVGALPAGDSVLTCAVLACRDLAAARLAWDHPPRGEVPPALSVAEMRPVMVTTTP